LLTIIINKSESIQAFVFYLTQYSLSNVNAFVILIAIGYTVYPFINKEFNEKDHKGLSERNNTPIQFTSELKGYFYINPMLAVSLCITLFSFAGIPPMAGFFAKQMVLSAALDSGYIFISIIAILTSVISAAYYLNVIKQIFFDENRLQLHEYFKNMVSNCRIVPYKYSKNVNLNNIKFGIENVTLSTFLTTTISILTLIILLFMFSSNE
jgi:NADH-ubiquinone oxidoreductase chain 2